ncbi:hypothetical protein CCO03_19040 [Comamonas serinivorans]|uniref:Uncharacterized protein n=1 Tax=Comamonas serinivorans TaxID=1082851 RepID=A0A1Y0ESC5_9BURK|nr:hypothetical protein CCO03_19040 [Comamonas serinivorans]
MTRRAAPGDADLAALNACGQPPVPVAIGHDVPGRHDGVARALDCTPPARLADGSSDPEAGDCGRQGGGGEALGQPQQRAPDTNPPTDRPPRNAETAPGASSARTA